MPPPSIAESNPSSASAESSRRAVWLAAALIVGAGLAAYSNSFSGAFVYDDTLTIVDNPSIRRWWPLTESLSPPPDSGLPVAGRPLVNFSLAVNYALGGTRVAGYHGLNLLIHLAAGLTLFGCIRRTLLQPALRDRFVRTALPFAAGVALLWTVHPLQTSAVTYVVQRAESLMGLFYLGTLYGFIRSIQSSSPKGWYIVAWLACLAGMASKEVMVSAPLLVLLYDRTFIAGSFREALRTRRGLYAGLASTWLLLAFLVAHAASRGGTAGFDSPIGWWDYVITQARAITHYLRLAIWPHPLVFDYGVEVAGTLADVWPQALLVISLGLGTIFAVRRGSPLGVVGFWFFAILAPSSSIVPVATETMAEHRMYLPLAAVMLVLGMAIQKIIPRLGWLILLPLALGFGVMTWQRNLDYRSELSIWSDTVDKVPTNPRAQFNLGVILFGLGRTDEAIAAYEETLRLKPNLAIAHSNLAHALFQSGRVIESRRHAEQALRSDPTLAEAHANLGNVLFQDKRIEEALQAYAEAVRLKPNDADLRNNLGTALAALGRLPAAAAEYETAVTLRPDFAVGYFHLGNTLARMGRFSEAASRYEEALRCRPDYPAARDNLARVRALQRARE